MSNLSNQYIIAQEEHDYNKTYEEGSIVKHTIDDIVTAYTAKQNVPRFVSILDERYWKKLASISNSDVTIDYSDLENKPTINGTTINGNITGKDLGLVDLPDNSINELEDRTFITTQEQFDQMIANANEYKAVNAVLGNGTFIVKTPIASIRNNFILIGSKNTVLKRNNRTFTRVDSDINANTDTHWAFAVGEEPVQPFSIFLDETNDYVKVSEYAHVCYTTEPYMNGNGQALSNTTKSEIFYIPKGNINIPATQLLYVYGYINCAWGITKFVLTGNIVNITKSGTSTVVECFEARCLPNNPATSTRTQTSNPNYYCSSDRRGLNSFVLFNTGTDGNLYYNGTHIMVPNAFNSIEVVDGWHYFNSFDENDFGGRPQYFIGPNTRGYNSDKVIIEGITFRNFQNVIYLSETLTNDNVIQMHGFTVRDCVFEKCTARAITTILCARTGMFNQKEKSYITNCKFIECGLSNYDTLHITAQHRQANGGNKNCLATGIEWVSIEDCEVCGSIDGRVQYKKTQLVHIAIDGTMKRCLLNNTGRLHIGITKGNVKVESCELFNTEKFNADKERNASSDGGMIYIDGASNRFNPEVVIKDNVFHDGIDMNGVSGSFKAIYIDEGRTNVLVQDNVIYNCMGSGIGARVTDSGSMNFYGWTNDSDVIYTNIQTSKGLSAVFSVNSQTNELEFTGDFIDFAPLNSPSEITYDGKTWTYDSTKNITDKQWSSANVRYIDNIVEGTMTIRYGDDVPSTLTPVASGNIQLGTFGAGFGSDSNYDSVPPYNKNDVYDNTNKVVNDYYINNGVHVDEDTYAAASVNMKKKLFYDKGFVKPVGIRTVSYDNTTTTVVQQMVSNIVYDCSELSELTISVPSSVDINYISQINFASGSTATQLTAPATIVWDGDSIDTNSLFVPETNMRYTVMLYSDGSNILGIVRGTAIPTTQSNNE